MKILSKIATIGLFALVTFCFISCGGKAKGKTIIESDQPIITVSQPQPQTETKSEPKYEPKPELKAEPESETVSDPKPENIIPTPPAETPKQEQAKVPDVQEESESEKCEPQVEQPIENPEESPEEQIEEKPDEKSDPTPEPFYVEFADMEKFSDWDYRLTVSSSVCTVKIFDTILTLKFGNNIFVWGDCDISFYRKHIFQVNFSTGEIQYIEEGDFATRPTDPIRTGYTFKGWQHDFNNKITGNTNVVAVWSRNIYVITYFDGAKIIDFELFEFESVIIFPNNPAKAGYNFIGWVLECGEVMDFDRMPAYNMNLYAQFGLIQHQTGGEKPSNPEGNEIKQEPEDVEENSGNLNTNTLNDFEYIWNGSGITITKTSLIDRDITIPTHIDGFVVTAVDMLAFRDLNLRSVTMLSSSRVEIIGDLGNMLIEIFVPPHLYYEYARQSAFHLYTIKEFVTL